MTAVITENSGRFPVSAFFFNTGRQQCNKLSEKIGCTHDKRGGIMNDADGKSDSDSSDVMQM